MAILNHANHLLLNLQMRSLLLGTTINFFDCDSKDVFISQYAIIVTKEYLSTNQM